MTRRRFMDKLIATFKATLIASLLPPGISAAAADHGEARPLHYSPLDGRSLREIALRREHHGNGRFLNPLGPGRKSRLWQVLAWKLFHTNKFQNAMGAQPESPVAVDLGALARGDGLSVTFLKHASLMLCDNGRRMLVDPIFSDLFWFIRDFTPLAFDPLELPPPDHVLITHGHYDHLDTASLGQLDKSVHIIAPLGYGDILDETGLHRRTELDWFGSYREKGREITLLPCNHWTMRDPIAGPNLALWGSYLIRTRSGHTVYVAGDTAYFDGFGQIGREFDIDLAVFNLGAYEPRWFMAPSHIDPRETVRAFQELGARKLAIMHWGSFRLGDEPVHLPPVHLRAEMARAGLLDRLVDWKHGDTIRL
jgi:L-ascorbate metabolism protein UlaG (beta-lactamase superfamily)